MIRKLSSGKYRLYSRKVNPKTGKRRNLGTFGSRATLRCSTRQRRASKGDGRCAGADHPSRAASRPPQDDGPEARDPSPPRLC